MVACRLMLSLHVHSDTCLEVQTEGCQRSEEVACMVDEDMLAGYFCPILGPCARKRVFCQ